MTLSLKYNIIVTDIQYKQFTVKRAYTAFKRALNIFNYTLTFMKLVKITQPVDALLALPFISSIEQYYPQLKEWYVNTIVSDLDSSNNVIIALKDHDNIIGLGLAKKGIEKKIRCVRVRSDYAGNGIGIQLIDALINEIECEKPLCTVAEELFHDYSRIFVNRYGFSLDTVVKGAYRPSKLEYYFNS